MLIDQLARIPELQHLTPVELRGLSSAVHSVCIPAARQIVQSGKVLNAYCFLLRGKLRMCAPQRELRANPEGALRHFYPGCDQAQSLSAVNILRIDTAYFEFLACAPCHQADTLVPVEEDWLNRFLTSHMMKPVALSVRQRMLRAFEACQVGRGESIVQQGAKAEHCFVIQSGHAVVHRDAKTLCYLGPGDFFGEDAIILDRGRNAHVTALDDMQVHAIAANVFIEMLTQSLLQPAPPGLPNAVRLNLDKMPTKTRGFLIADLRQQHKGWRRTLDYYVSGGKPAERILCTLLLMQKGLRAFDVGASTGA